ncbi:3-isopropylmalate dehydratase small subunit 2 [Pleurocapsa sp. PCC 7319]|uniref:3-isopropylmalate dehydratase small subunit n=1 Tax=Pleurocapsa sp. PCC 7319 TaxID=118161 RepID=UPI000348700E|nr:hypothetical protein [Pleurocapsa sp. PCC 7319]
METLLPKIVKITGTSIVLSQNDIDTDRIIPARFLKSLSFDNLGENVFHDDRKYYRSIKGNIHPFDDSDRRNANILFVAQNFGCGSSREHAAQALLRRGIEVIVGESFGEIFLGNCSVIGLPCVVVDSDIALKVRQLAKNNPFMRFSVNLEEKTLRVSNSCWDVNMNETIRQNFVSGYWNTLSILEAADELIADRWKKLPYLYEWKM